MSFFGGGTDYKEYYENHGGSVLSATFDKYCFVTVRDYPPFFNFRNQFTYSAIERFNSPEELGHPLVREAFGYFNEDRLQISYDADLPARSGIGSSSSFAVGLSNAIRTLRGQSANAYSLARDAIILERELCREAGGIQDQIAAAYGGFNRINFYSDGFEVRQINVDWSILEKLSANLLLLFSGTGHFSGEIAKEQSARIGMNTALLDEMKQMTEVAEKLLVSGKTDDFGALMGESWLLKTRLAGNITTPLVDDIYLRAKKSGALGGKLLGAGGGGFVLLYVPEKYRAAVRSELREFMEVPFSFERQGSTIIYNSDGK